jgi:SNF2 family DNA or RNA helicase
MINGENPITQEEFNIIYNDENKFKEYFKCKISIFNPSLKESKIFYPRYKINEVFVFMDKNYEKEYLQVEEDTKHNQVFKNPKIFYNGVRRASNKIGDLLSPKIEWIENFIKNNINDKYIIFSHWLECGIQIIDKLLNKLNISHKFIDGTISKEKRKEIVEKYNRDEIKILLISKAGGEGLDLKGTRRIILLEPGWNPAIDEQVIGRGIRYKSHYHLDKKNQIVDVYKLYLRKNREKNIKKYENVNDAYVADIKWSVDLYLRALCNSKKEMIKDFINKLQKYSIEKNKC